LWKKTFPTNSLEILQPHFIFLKHHMGYDYISSSNYGVAINENESIEVAGTYQPNKIYSLYQINSL
jgi:hypothetical protein